MTVYVCPDRDSVCGGLPDNWCESCPKRKKESEDLINDAERFRWLERHFSIGGVNINYGCSWLGDHKVRQSTVEPMRGRSFRDAFDKHFGVKLKSGKL